MPGMENLAPERTDTSSGSAGVADGLAHGLLEPGAGAGHLGVEALGPAAGHVGAAGVGRDGEPGRHRELEYRRHLGQVGALATQEVLELHGRAGVRVVEIEDERHRASLPWTGEPRSERGHSKWSPFPTWDGPTPAYFPPGVAPERVSAGAPPPGSSSGAPGIALDGAGDLALEDLLGLAHEVAHDGELVGLEALGHLAHLLGDGLLQALQALLGRRDDLDPDPPAVLGVAAPGHHARLLQAVEDEGDGPGGQPALLGQAARGQRAEAANKVEAAHVGPAQLQLLGQALVEVAGGAEVAHDLGAQLLGQLRARPLS